MDLKILRAAAWGYRHMQRRNWLSDSEYLLLADIAAIDGGGIFDALRMGYSAAYEIGARSRGAHSAPRTRQYPGLAAVGLARMARKARLKADDLLLLAGVARSERYGLPIALGIVHCAGFAAGARSGARQRARRT